MIVTNLNNRTLTRKETSLRRSSMLIKVLTFNLSYNHLSLDKKDYLLHSFKESKYYYNFLLSWSQQTIVDDFGNLVYPNSLNNIDTKNNLIVIFNSLTLESYQYEIKYLSSQIKQKIVDKVIDNIKGLSSAKSKGRKTGKLKFKSSVNIPLKQYNNTFYLDDDCKYLSIQGCKKEINNFKLFKNKGFTLLYKELGFKIKDNIKMSLSNLIDSNIIEVANAELIKTGNKQNLQYKLNVTIYINPEIYNNSEEEVSNKPYLVESTGKKRFNSHRNIKVNNNLNKDKALDEVEKNKLSNIVDEINNVGVSNIVNDKVVVGSKVKQFHMNLTQEQQDYLSCTCVGIDAGIATEFTLSIGSLYEAVKIDSRNNPHLLNVLSEIKLTQTELNKFINRSKKLNRKKLSISKNTYDKSRQYYVIKNKLNKLWLKYENIKSNMVNHLVSLLINFEKVYFQDEMIKYWHKDKMRGYGKKIQSGILGKVYGKLKLLNKKNPSKYIMLSKSAKTTQTCMNNLCGKENPTELGRQVYVCECGYKNDRDSHSAYSMIEMGKKLVNETNEKESKQELGRDSANLVKNLTTIDNIEKLYSIIKDKLSSKAYIKATKSSYI